MSLGEAASKASQEWCGPLTQNHDPAYWKSIREAYACGFMRGFNDCDSRKRASDREHVVSKTAEAKHVASGAVLGIGYAPETPFTATADNRLVYNLKQDGWLKGEPRMTNDIAVSITAWQLDAETLAKVAKTIQDALNTAFPMPNEKS